MLSLYLRTDASRQATRARLAAAVAARPSLFSLKPIRISDWLAQYEGKSFIGTLAQDDFKVWLLNVRTSGVRRRGYGVVVVGTIEDGGVRARLRPPMFNLLLSCFLIVAVGGAFVLSFHGPSNTAIVRWLLAGFLIIPLALLTWSFVLEARTVERTLGRVIGAVGAVGVMTPGVPRAPASRGRSRSP